MYFAAQRTAFRYVGEPTCNEPMCEELHLEFGVHSGYMIAIQCARHNPHSRSAMTLFEILAVLVILGMLASVLAIGLSGAMSESQQHICGMQIARVQECVEKYRLNKRKLPPSGNGLGVLSAPDSQPSQSWFIESGQLNDPWGNPLQYLVPGPDGHAFEIVSYGADGAPGGDGENADISSAASTHP